MLIKRILLPFVATFIGFAISPSYAGDIISCDSFENCADGSVPLTNALLALEARMDALEAENAALKTDNKEFKRILAGVTRLNDPDNFDMDTLRFTNMNLQIVSGTNSTNGLANGTGNLIIGYNEQRASGNDRSGSHMLVLGKRNNYSSYGGIVAGFWSETSGKFSSVTGGYSNTASGDYASVSGGESNTASGNFASVSGGNIKTAATDYCTTAGEIGTDC